MSNDISLLDDTELEAASGGVSNTGMDGNSSLDSTPPGTTLGRVKTSEKQTKAVLAFIKG
jgi:hypothetical protein